MYLSKLILDPSPAARAVQRDLAAPYDLHRTLMRAFPDKEAGGPGRVLFRLEPLCPGEPPVVLVQSEKQPDWSDLQRHPRYLISAESKSFKLNVQSRQQLRFRLRANPTVKRNKKRVGLVRQEDQVQWLKRKAEAGGFHPVDFTVRKSTRYASIVQRDEGRRKETHLGVDYEGVLEISDPDQFTSAVAAGIGSAKGYGFGLLSVAPL